MTSMRLSFGVLSGRGLVSSLPSHAALKNASVSDSSALDHQSLETAPQDISPTSSRLEGTAQSGTLHYG